MSKGVNRRTHFDVKAIASLLLLIFAILFLAEISHSHRSTRDSALVGSKAPEEASLDQARPSCEWCDYILHQSHRLLPVSYHFHAAPARVIVVSPLVQEPFIYLFNDLLLFSGNSPPLVQTIYRQA
ncbi:hypothetical protein [Pedobacter sp. SYSU D00535]|uniref:hypothetical protein n=1 Tax=Pedobacter sp. SYSU D00535 TaxID=2810308 RepID=UPI001A96C3A9|nr:hypothetical protein [Pedobacter sp. SYSU D00535]